jgi:hypothetical protein
MTKSETTIVKKKSCVQKSKKIKTPTSLIVDPIDPKLLKTQFERLVQTKLRTSLTKWQQIAAQLKLKNKPNSNN